MTKAWEIAKSAVARFGGSAVEYLSGALKMAWSEVKKGVEKMEGSEKQVAWAKDIKAKYEMFLNTFHELNAKEELSYGEAGALSTAKHILFGNNHNREVSAIKKSFAVTKEERRAMTSEQKAERKVRIQEAVSAYENEKIENVLSQNQASFWINKYKWLV